ncbi:hypothetical protein AbraIFM66950_008072 [Aspergillus brasiliensis]|nr:hypothetical protein AbraIFM66950_008072 [Aspergillus brasiliensis]
MARTYENALNLLETRRRRGRPLTDPPIETGSFPANVTTTVRGIPSLHGMSEWLQTLGHSCIRERIQINNKPVTEDLFTNYFFEVWDKLMDPDIHDTYTGQQPPRYLQFLALLAFHTFIRESVGAAIIEVHHGGEFDATNVIQNPVVTAITSLGLDHVAQLGPTIESIAWHKSGIFKSGAPALSVPQGASPTEVLHARAAEKNTSLTIVPLNPNLPPDSRVLEIPVQRLNCSLAVELARAFLNAKAPDHVLEPDDISTAVRNISLIGRFEIMEDPDGQSQWFLDGAHNTLSLKQTAEWWFSEVTRRSAVHKYRILIFSHFSKDRDGLALLECLAASLTERDALPDHVIFTTYIEREDESEKIDKDILPSSLPNLSLLSLYAEKWKTLDPRPATSISTKETIEEAIDAARIISAQQDTNGTQVLITGSLRLVGGALNILRP